jgi:hypothetical protein
MAPLGSIESDDPLSIRAKPHQEISSLLDGVLLPNFIERCDFEVAYSRLLGLSQYLWTGRSIRLDQFESHPLSL